MHAFITVNIANFLVRRKILRLYWADAIIIKKYLQLTLPLTSPFLSMKNGSTPQMTPFPGTPEPFLPRLTHPTANRIFMPYGK